MKEIPLSQGYVALVDDGDFERLMQFKWRVICGHSTHYALTQIHGKGIYLHRLIMDAPAGMEVDHRDHDGLNNVRSNLRICTRIQNLQNKKRRRDSKSPYKGVVNRDDRKHFEARIVVNKKYRHIGMFKTPEEAARAYDAAAREHFGPFARTNFNGDEDQEQVIGRDLPKLERFDKEKLERARRLLKEGKERLKARPVLQYAPPNDPDLLKALEVLDRD